MYVKINISYFSESSCNHEVIQDFPFLVSFWQSKKKTKSRLQLQDCFIVINRKQR